MALRKSWRAGPIGAGLSSLLHAAGLLLIWTGRPAPSVEGPPALTVAMADADRVDVPDDDRPAPAPPPPQGASRPPPVWQGPRPPAPRRPAPAPSLLTGSRPDRAPQLFATTAAAPSFIGAALPAAPPRRPSALALRPAPRPPVPVDPDLARRLRIYDSFPAMPAGAVPRSLATVTVCVSARGQADEVTIAGGVPPANAAVLRGAVLTWRYHPLLVDGVPTPFCHLIRIEYQR
jgi:hypothetical protein